jgi:TonB-dependent receptor
MTGQSFKVMFCLYMFGFTFYSSLLAQEGTGTVEGKVTEQDIRFYLPGAAIWVENTNNGAISDNEGNYRLLNVPAGKQIIHIRYLGYEQKNIEINIEAGKTMVIDVVLNPVSIQGAEVVITAQLRGQNRAINQQLNSNSIVNIVSEDKIREVPDVNAAEAIGRLPGVAVLRSGGEGQKLMIRGLEPRFSTVTVNGVKVPASSDTDRSTELSMISSDMLSGIELFKSPTPDMDGDAIGGTVNLLVKKAPDEMKARVNLSGAYNVLNKDHENYKNHVQLSRRFFDKKLGVIFQAQMERNNRGSEEMSAGYRLISEADTQRLGGSNVSLVDNNQVRKRKGVSANIDYNLGNHTNFSFYTLYSVTDNQRVSRSKTADPFWENSINYNYNNSESKLELWSGSILTTHKLPFAEIEWSLSRAQTLNNTPYHFNMHFVEEASFANGEFDKYDHPEVFLASENMTSNNYLKAYLYNNSFSPRNGKELQNTAFFNITVPVNIGSKIGGFVKLGGKYNSIDRFNNEYSHGLIRLYLGGSEMNTAITSYPGTLDMTSTNKIAMTNFLEAGNQFSDFLGKGYVFQPVIDNKLGVDWYEHQKDNLVYDRSATTDNYTAFETVSAGYIMSKLNVGKMFTIIPGVRYEYSDNDYTGKYSSLDGDYGVNGYIRDTFAVVQYGVWLPHLHLKFKPARWFDIRFSAAKTLARPNFNYVAPRTDIDILNSRLNAGNPRLKHMESWNYDLFLSFYNGKYGLLSVGGFYKELKDVFYSISGYVIPDEHIADSLGFPGYSFYSLTSYGNSSQGNVRGLEVDLQANLKFLPKPFDGIVLSANFTRLWANTSKYHYTSKPIYQFDPIWGQRIVGYDVDMIERKITIPGLVPYILNLSVGYDFKGFSGRVSANYQADNLMSAAQSELLDVYGKAFWKVDAVFSQKLYKDFSVVLNLININNQKEERYMGLNGFPTSIRNYGPIIQMGIIYDL